MLRRAEEYYALYVEWEDGKSEIAVLEWEENEGGTHDAIAVYTTPDGPVQQEDLEKWEAEGVALAIQKASHEELLDTMQREYPRSVFIDGQKVTGSVFTGLLQTELGPPIEPPRRVKLDDLDSE